MFDVKGVFNSNLSRFGDEAGTPISSEVFHEKYITPAYKRSHAEGFAMESAYGKVITDYQSDGFIVGFRAAVQLMIDCVPKEAEKG